MIDPCSALTNDRAAATREAAALAGVLVGQISWHQENSRSIGRPLDSGVKGNELSKNGRRTLTTALEGQGLRARLE